MQRGGGGIALVIHGEMHSVAFPFPLFMYFGNCQVGLCRPGDVIKLRVIPLIQLVNL